MKKITFDVHNTAWYSGCVFVPDDWDLPGRDPDEFRDYILKHEEDVEIDWGSFDFRFDDAEYQITAEYDV